MKLGRILATGLVAGAITIGAAPITHISAQSTGKVVASGLNSPRGVTIDDAGNLYVADSGVGGDIPFGSGDFAGKAGNTGSIVKIAPDGTKTTVVSGLFSIVSNDGEANGPSGVAYDNGSLWVVGSFQTSGEITPTAGLLKADISTGKTTFVADLQAYEAKNNPDPNLVDSNPYGVAVGKDGMVYVADAGGNDLLKVDPATGNISTVAVFPGVPLPNIPETANPDRGGAHEADPVPTGIDVAEDGHIFVGFLTGFPFADGAASIAHVSADGHVSTEVTGLTMVTDVAVGPDDTLYASQFGTFSLTSTPPGFQPGSGKIIRNTTNGTTEVIASGLDAANGIALSPDGSTIYVANNSVGAPGSGQILSFSTQGTGAPVGMPVTGNSSFPIEYLVAALLLVLAGASVRTAATRKSL